MIVDEPRRLAADLVLAVEQQAAYSNLMLPRLIGERKLTSTDAAFATELTYGTLRWQGVLDQVVSSASGREIATLDPPVRAVLRLGAYQLLHMRVPPHAAVSTTVDLARVVAGPRPVGLVNAVMRKISQRSWSQWVTDLAPSDSVGAAAFARGYPAWVAAAFLDALHGDASELERALQADRPTTHLLARPGEISREDLLAVAGEGASAGPFSPYAVHLAGGDPGKIAAIRDRRARVQDEGSQLMALALARAEVDGRDLQWLDACAGPGGKASLLEGLLPEGATLLAGELQPHRATLVRTGLARRAAAVVVADATRPPWRPEAFDRVLVDAPCSGLGALRRRPEVRWRRQPGDIEHLVPLQRALLDSAATSTRPGGVVGYVTCSPHRSETEDVVAAVIAARGDLVPIDARPLLPGVPDLGAGPTIQLWPQRHGTDAMFLALLRRS